MAKKVTCYLKDVGVLDDDSVMVVLDFDGLDNPDKVVEKIKARKAFGARVSAYDVLAVMFFMYAANKAKDRD